MSNNDTSTLQLLAESMAETQRYIWLLLYDERTYSGLCQAMRRINEMVRDFERDREEAWMTNLNRIIGKQEATDEG